MKTSAVKYFGYIFIVCMTVVQSAAQDTLPEKKILVAGYIKDLQTFLFDKGFHNLISSNLIHNRINLKWKPSKVITGALEIRNRLFWGEEVNNTPGFADKLRNDNELIDLSKSWIRKNNMVLHTNIERLYIGFLKSKWDIRIGRQRINWGMTTLWNPNDIFNTYNFLDVDYEERPGSDAARIKYQSGSMTNLELAVAGTGYNHKSIAALKYFTNKWNYDFQLIAGYYKNEFIAGAGWAGSIKDAGFKGEFMYFAPGNDTGSQVTLVVECDYLFKKSWYLNIGGLLNSNGLNRPVSDWANFDFKLSPKNILPVKWALSVTGSKEITPIFSANMSIVYAPNVNLILILPGIKYNLMSNLDLDIIWQSFFSSINSGFEGIAHKGYFRLKWSF